MKNNFKKYGFEADFEGEIFSQYQAESYGVVYRENGNHWVVIWGENGICYDNDGNSIKKYNLKPIKKEWYEKSDSFPVAMVRIDDNELCICSTITEYNVHFKSDRFRPATKEEVIWLH